MPGRHTPRKKEFIKGDLRNLVKLMLSSEQLTEWILGQ